MITYPYATRMDEAYFKQKLEWFNILNFMQYDKEKAKQFLIEQYGWRDYGGKHHESFYTKFYQTYILPTKFGYEKRKAHLSSLIVAGQITREEAMEELVKPLYEEKELRRDTEYFLEKMQITQEEFDEIMNASPHKYTDYTNQDNDSIGKFKKKVLKSVEGSYELEKKVKKVSRFLLYILSIPTHIWHFHIYRQWRL